MCTVKQHLALHWMQKLLIVVDICLLGFGGNVLCSFADLRDRSFQCHVSPWGWRYVNFIFCISVTLNLLANHCNSKSLDLDNNTLLYASIVLHVCATTKLGKFPCNFTKLEKKNKQAKCDFYSPSLHHNTFYMIYKIRQEI